MSEFSLSDYSPLQVLSDPYPFYAALRRESPVHQVVPGLPFYVLSRYEEAVYALHHPELFSSTAFQVLLQGGLPIIPNSGGLAGHRLLKSPMMISTDPPDHERLRKLVNRGFTPRRIAALEPRLRGIVCDQLARVLPTGRMELVRDLSIPFPVRVISELLGVDERLDQFKHWSQTIVMGLSNPTTEITCESVRKAADEMADYLERVADERRAAPRDDLVSLLVQAEEGEVLSTSELLSFIVLLLIAGNETTTNLIGNAVRALLLHPDALAELRMNPGLIPAMIEETLRWDSPLQGLPRQTREEVELAGTRLPKGAFVLVLFASANRDERRFPAAERYDIHRDTAGHLAFGHGIHFCLGAALARLEARIALEELLRRTQLFALAAETEIEMLESSVFRGPKAIPLEFEVA